VTARISTSRGKRRQGRTREEKRAANRQRLLDAALEVFSERGYHAATIEEIAAEAGLSNGAVYYNFRNKEDLFLALFDQRIQARIAAVERTFGAGTAGDEETVTQVESAAMHGVRDIDNPKEWAMFFEFVAHAARAPAFRREFRKRARRLRAAFARAIERQTAELGSQLALPPEQVAVAIAALTQGLAVQRVTDAGAVPDELLGQLIVYLLRGMTLPGPEGHDQPGVGDVSRARRRRRG
jgi:AcrR family transcriptional regulator